MDFHDKVIYQIYPKSFYDSNDDGIGDLRGIIAKIPYLAKLNIDMIWFNPFFVSPQNDNGYDIADYYAIDPRFGTMADFDELVAKLKEHDIEVMLDMVFNHTSTAHEWFQKALAGDVKYQDYYILRETQEDGSLPTNWESKFGGSAWAPFGKTGKYYLHLYDVTQADLNWHNPAVRQAVYDVLNFWRAKGVHGFRFDVINVIGKDTQLVDAPVGVASKTLYTDKPIVQDYLQEMNAATFGQDAESITVGEMSSTSIANSVAYTQPENHELGMVFTFHHLKTDYRNGEKWSKMPFDFKMLKKTLNDWQVGMNDGHGWNALFWNNHDQPRALNRFGDPVKYREKSAEMLATVMHLLRGTPYIYMGEEIGMTDPEYQSMAEYVDIESLNAYQELLTAGNTPAKAFEIVQTKSRDNSRTPMQWDASKYAGFSNVKPWLTSTNQVAINVEAELAHGEVFNYYQKLIALRKNLPIVAEGDYQSLLMEHETIFAFERNLDNKKLVVLTNFYGEPAKVTLPSNLDVIHATVLLGNYQDTPRLTTELNLRPYEAVAYLIEL
ncbi:alpha,alpha-phosphotrehalase [Periweissella cryptocerci]|uniref:Alpha,alpha-phosphotrehalase n=1 Tax=Periweissella cryptocerci TaxID=2506420 RepID=A0A4P6YRF6_9LACO|nr:alpha,alpha-phosphotrehalase [Periweissella cryptocerci]QBO35183.1 alpha,alpha-phosphotrehalase [Periweissella cryptocerci]